MSKPGKIFLIIGAMVLAAFLLLGAGAWYWWNRNSAALIEAGKAAMADGRSTGTHLEESRCVIRALERHRADWNRSLMSSVRNGLWLTGCLETSKPQVEFCVGVPAQDEIVGLGVWSGTTCSQNGLADPYCPTLLQNVAKYCSSPQRAEKARTGKPSDSALNTDLWRRARQAG